MITLTGKKISEGIAIGKLSFYKRDTKEIRRIYVKDVEKEVMRFQKARQKALQELSKRRHDDGCGNTRDGICQGSWFQSYLYRCGTDKRTGKTGGIF